MSRTLKEQFDRDMVATIAADLRRARPRFDAEAFLSDALAGIDGLELMARGGQVAGALRRHLPPRFPDAARVLVASLGPELERTEGAGFEVFRYLPHVLFAARYGLDDFEPAMHLQYELTKRFSAEFSIRAYLERHPEATLERLREWTRDPNVHVRRLVSEGTRPRLPWAPRLRGFQRDPTPVLRLLELLRNDPERYVQRSVANNLNDIAKDHPDTAVEVCRRWAEDAPATDDDKPVAKRDAPAGRSWVIRHALRSLAKRGHRGALAVLGADAKPRVRLGRVVLEPRRVRRGEVLRFSVELHSTSRETQSLLLDYAVHFVKASGKTAPKVFRLRQLTLEPGAKVLLAGRVSFAPMTTRRAHPGKHHLELLVNGTPLPAASFDVR